MGQTSRGIIFPSDYSKIADVPADLQEMAESIDDILQQDELNIQNNSDNIETLQTNVSTHEQSIQNNTTDINTLKNQVQSFALISETGSKVEIEINSLTYVMKIILKDKNDNVINTSNEIDLPLETMVVGARYDSGTQELVITLKNGQETRFSIADLIDGLVSQTDFDELAEIVQTNTETIDNNTTAIAANIAEINNNSKSIENITNLIDTELDTGTVEGTTIDVDDSAEWEGSIVPKGNLKAESKYKQLDYIKATGTQYIDTGFVPNQNTKIELDFELDEFAGDNYSAICGARVASNNKMYELFASKTLSNIRYDFYNHVYSTVGKAIQTLKRYKAVFDKNGIYIDDVLYGNVTDTYYSGEEFSCENSFYLCSINSTTTENAHMKVYGLKMYDNGVLVRDLVPCINPEGNTGLYDTVEKKFYANAGTGEFVQGSIIELTDLPEVPQDIKVATGSNTIHHSNRINVFDEKKYAESNVDYFSYDEQNGLSLKKQDTRAMDKVGMNFEVESNKEYCIKFNNTCSIMIAEYTSTGTWRRNTRLNAGNTFTTQSTTAYIKVKFDRLDGIAYPVLIGNVSISQNDDYKEEKYQLSLGNIELCKIRDYEDTIFKNVEESKYYNSELVNSEFYKYNRIMKGNTSSLANPTVITTALADNLFGCVFSIAGINKVENEKYSVISNILSSKVLGTATDTENKDNVRFYQGIAKHTASNNQIVITVDKSYLSEISAQGLVNFLEDNNFYFYYILDKSTYEQITNPTLIAQLEALLKIQMYHGENHFWVETDNLEPVMDLTYKQSNKIKNEKQNARLDNIESRLALLE